VGTSHSATDAIKSALKYVSPDDHWISRRLATASGKCIKMRPLSAVVTIQTSTESATSRYCTTSTSQQHSYVSSDCRPARGSTTRRTCMSLAGRCKSPQCLIHSSHDFAPLLTTGANQQRPDPTRSHSSTTITAREDIAPALCRLA
jgi:hypothetical protein